MPKHWQPGGWHKQSLIKARKQMKNKVYWKKRYNSRCLFCIEISIRYYAWYICLLTINTMFSEWLIIQTNCTYHKELNWVFPIKNISTQRQVLPHKVGLKLNVVFRSFSYIFFFTKVIFCSYDVPCFNVYHNNTYADNTFV